MIQQPRPKRVSLSTRKQNVKLLGMADRKHFSGCALFLVALHVLDQPVRMIKNYPCGVQLGLLKLFLILSNRHLHKSAISLENRHRCHEAVAFIASQPLLSLCKEVSRRK